MIKMNKQTAVIYARVSTADQEYERQISEMEQYAKAQNYKVIHIYKEKLSGAKADRPELDAMLKAAVDGSINMVLVWDLSRLSRNAKDTLEIIEALNLSCCSLHIKGLSITTLDKDCKPDMYASLFLQILAAVYEMERKSIRLRMESGFKHHLANGGKVGRAAGYVKPIDQIKYFADIKRNLNAGLSFRKVKGALLEQNKKVSLGTIVKVQQHLSKEKAI
jgi:DNA invertase Pin-like site-specific DNA recombinase